MRKIERQMLIALQTRKDWSGDNTRVEVTYFAHGERIIDRASVYLHDNLIAKVTPDDVTICDCGWQTPTTKSRLNIILHELCGAGIYQKAHKWYGCPSDGPEFLIESESEHAFNRVTSNSSPNPTMEEV